MWIPQRALLLVRSFDISIFVRGEIKSPPFRNYSRVSVARESRGRNFLTVEEIPSQKGRNGFESRCTPLGPEWFPI
jgi:hypothetical protein